MKILALAALALVAILSFRIANRRHDCKVKQRIEELATRLEQISAGDITAEQRSVLNTAKKHLDLAREYWQNKEFDLAEQAISLAHLNAHSAESPADSHGVIH